MWSLRYSAADTEYLEAKGAPELANRVLPDNLFMWSAYNALRGSRQIGMAVGPIPFTEIAAYCAWLGMTCPVQKQRLVRMVGALDRAERDYLGRTDP